MSNIFLIGYRTTGKTSVSKVLSESLGRTVVSIDAEIEKMHGRIFDLVKRDGWERFREIESEILNSVSKKDGLIIDCGGGIIEKGKNRKILKKGIVFWLDAPIEVIEERIKKSDPKTRPPINGDNSISEVRTVYSRRLLLYENASDFKIDATRSIRKIAEEIRSLSETQLCIPVTAKNIEDAAYQLSEIEKKGCLAELRIDHIKDIDKEKLEVLLKARNRPVIVTCRPKNEGGRFNGDETSRLDLLRHAISCGAEFIDIEHETQGLDRLVAKKGKTKIIISSHDFNRTRSLEHLERLYTDMSGNGADLIKIVTHAESILDNFTIFRLLEGKKNLIAFCMGIYGHISRVLAPKYGSKITFASLGGIGTASAPGQISYDEMQVYNISSINPKTDVIGVIGEHAENSRSKYMHNPNFKKSCLNYVYLPFKVKSEELERFMELFREFRFKGAAVTIPHKQDVIKLLDRLDPTAKDIGATNTVVRAEGKLSGYNTDYYGAIEALKEKTKLRGKKVLVLGAGGASRAICYGLSKERAKVTVMNRTSEKADALSQEFGLCARGYDDVGNIASKSDIIINTTSVGMNPDPDASIIDKKDIPEGKIIMDIVYNPLRTLLLKLAEKKGCKTISGDLMLIYQAIGQFEIWTGKRPAFRDMESALHDMQKKYQKNHKR